MTHIDAGSRPGIGAGYRLQWEDAQQCHVLLYPEGMVKLNGSAGQILQRCDGQRTVAAIVAELESAFGTAGLEPQVLAFMQLAADKHWLVCR